MKRKREYSEDIPTNLLWEFDDENLTPFPKRPKKGEFDMSKTSSYTDAMLIEMYFQEGSIFLFNCEFHSGVDRFTRSLYSNLQTNYIRFRSNIYYHRGLCYYYLGEYSKACSDFTHSIEHLEHSYTHEFYPSIYRLRHTCFCRLKKYDLAVRDITYFMQSYPLEICEGNVVFKYPYCYIQRGMAYYLKGSYLEAMEDVSFVIDALSDESVVIDDCVEYVNDVELLVEGLVIRMNCYEKLKLHPNALEDASNLIRICDNDIDKRFIRKRTFYLKKILQFEKESSMIKSFDKFEF